MIKQLRRSGGIWLCCEGTNVLVDPGPGSVLCCAQAKPRLDPACLDAIILTHRHLDHANDVNVMIEGMTDGGFKKRGLVFCPQDALQGDSTIQGYIRGFPEEIKVISGQQRYSAGNFTFETSVRHLHPVETYGITFGIGAKKAGILSDTRNFDGLIQSYRGLDLLIVGVVFVQPRPEIDHLSAEDLSALLPRLAPKRVVLTHFGLRMLEAGPEKVARKLSRQAGIPVVAARDGMTIEF
jgi:phosphoribosyl 1,2-cyclic phosphodiesterase